MRQISELTYEECEALLRAGVFGRVALTTLTGPLIVPVNYVVVGGAILVRTSPGSLLDRYAGSFVVAFEVDNVNYERAHGWSVVATGRCERIASDQLTEEERRTPGPPTWVRRDADLWIRLRWVTLTGRRLGKGWSPIAEMPVRRV